MGAEKIGMEAVKFTGSRSRGEGAEEMLDAVGTNKLRVLMAVALRFRCTVCNKPGMAV